MELWEGILLIGVILSLPKLIPYLMSPLDPDERKAQKKAKEERRRQAKARMQAEAERQVNIPKAGSKDSLSDLNQSWEMHTSSKIFGIDDYSGFGGFDNFGGFGDE